MRVLFKLALVLWLALGGCVSDVPSSGPEIDLGSAPLPSVPEDGHALALDLGGSLPDLHADRPATQKIDKGHVPALDGSSGPTLPNFSLTDINPKSPTYKQKRTLSAVRGTVVVLYFGDFT
jgi:hypothetical protein